MKSNNRFHYKTRKDANNALIISLNSDFDWESITLIDFWFREFLRDTPEDIGWLNVVINNIGHDCGPIGHWFMTQSQLPDSWSKTTFETIKLFSALYKE